VSLYSDGLSEPLVASLPPLPVAPLPCPTTRDGDGDAWVEGCRADDMRTPCVRLSKHAGAWDWETMGKKTRYTSPNFEGHFLHFSG
jgi:hypothetical protein